MYQKKFNVQKKQNSYLDTLPLADATSEENLTDKFRVPPVCDVILTNVPVEPVAEVEVLVVQ